MRQKQLQNYAMGEWVAGTGKSAELFNAITGEVIGETSSGGLDFAAMAGVCARRRRARAPQNEPSTSAPIC